VKALVLAGLVATVLVGCLRADEHQHPGTDDLATRTGFHDDPSSGIEFEVIEEGRWSNIHDRRTLAVRSESAWDALWKEHGGGNDTPPSVDFERHMVLALFWGELAGLCGERIVVHHLWNATASEMRTNLTDVALGVEGEWYKPWEHPVYSARYGEVSQGCDSAVTQLYLFLRAPRIEGAVGFEMGDRTHYLWFAPYRWSEGESWNYTIRRADRVEGWARWTVAATRDGSHELEEVVQRGSATERSTLAWPDDVLRFPLEHRKSWSDDEGWHTAVFRREANVTGRPFEDVWLVLGSGQEREANATQIDVYDHDERGLVLRAWSDDGRWDAATTETWELVEHRRP
jgi:hypothetical protein